MDICVRTQHKTRAQTAWCSLPVTAQSTGLLSTAKEFMQSTFISYFQTLTTSPKVDNILREQGIQLIILHQGILKLLQHLKDKGQLFLLAHKQYRKHVTDIIYVWYYSLSSSIHRAPGTTFANFHFTHLEKPAIEADFFPTQGGPQKKIKSYSSASKF